VLRAAAGLAAMLGVGACGALRPEPAADDRVAALATDLGCHACHARVAPPLGRGPVPVAPAWPEIAARYRHQPRAGGELARVLIEGTEERHWKGEPFVAMLPHEKWVTAGEARELVRWILTR
jgi:cytochrome c551/c552